MAEQVGSTFSLPGSDDSNANGEEIQGSQGAYRPSSRGVPPESGETPAGVMADAPAIHVTIGDVQYSYAPDYQIIIAEGPDGEPLGPDPGGWRCYYNALNDITQEINASADMGDQAATPRQGLEAGNIGGEPTAITDVSSTDTPTPVDSGESSPSQSSSPEARGLDSHKPVTVIGETQARVTSAAKMLENNGFKVNTYEPRSKVPGLEARRSWIRYCARIRGSQMVDIGRDPGRLRPPAISTGWKIEVLRDGG